MDNKSKLPRRVGALIGEFDLRIDTHDRIKKTVLEEIKLPEVPEVPLSDRAFTSLVTGTLRKLTLQIYDLVAAEEAVRASKHRYTIPSDELRVRVSLVVRPRVPPKTSPTAKRPLATIWGDGEVWINGKRVERARRS